MLIMQYKPGSGTGGGNAPGGGGSTTPNCTAPHFLDDTYWESSDFSMFWVGASSEWTSTGSAASWVMSAIGTWADGLRPSSMDFTFERLSSGIDTNDTELQVFDTNNDPISANIALNTYALDVQHTINIPLTFGSFDLDRMTGQNFMYNQGFKVRCINFLA